MIAGFLKKDEAKIQCRSIRSGRKRSYYDRICACKEQRYSNTLKVILITGRSHQIRAHLASIGHPILGDFKYGDPKVNEQIQKKYKVRSQLLHSWKLVMPGKNGAAFRIIWQEEFIALLPAAFKNKAEKA